MTTYYMTIKSNSTDAYWEKCKATTLLGAKREATNEYYGGFNDSEVMISTGDNMTAQRHVMSTKRAEQKRWCDDE